MGLLSEKVSQVPAVEDIPSLMAEDAYSPNAETMPEQRADPLGKGTPPAAPRILMPRNDILSLPQS